MRTKDQVSSILEQSGINMYQKWQNLICVIEHLCQKDILLKNRKVKYNLSYFTLSPLSKFWSYHVQKLPL